MENNDLNNKCKKLLETVVSLNGEISFGNYVYNYLTQLGLFDHVEKAIVDGDRFNIYAYKGKPKVIFCSHLDTVKQHQNQQKGWKGDKYFELGTKDMKGGIVSVLIALAQSSRLKDVGLIFYIGEETDQLGIKSIVENWNFQPKLVVCPESRFVIGNGGRGLLVFQTELTGKKAHSARPHLGINAVDALIEFVNFCNQKLTKVKNPLFNESKVTILSLKSHPEDNIEGVIPDKCFANLEIRTTSSKINFEFIKKCKKEFEAKTGVKIELKLLDEYPFTYISPTKFKILEHAIEEANHKVEYADIKLAGFNDVFLLYHQYKTPVVNFGPYGENNHTADEWVSLNSVVATAQVFTKLIASI